MSQEKFNNFVNNILENVNSFVAEFNKTDENHGNNNNNNHDHDQDINNEDKTESNFPPTTVSEISSYYIYSLYIAGNIENLDIKVENDMLKVSGERIDPAASTEIKYIHQEVWFGKFFRSYNLPTDVDQDKIYANDDGNGIINIVAPKKQKDPCPSAKYIKINKGNDRPFGQEFGGKYDCITAISRSGANYTGPTGAQGPHEQQVATGPIYYDL